jgi:lactoylglutathione lyase
MKFCWTTIAVADFDKSLEFYTKVVGLTVDRAMTANPKMKLAFLGAGETKLELIYDEAATKRGFGEGISIGFEVESVDAFMAELRSRGVAIASGPHQPNPMVKFFYILDPDGLRVQFVENVKRG